MYINPNNSVYVSDPTDATTTFTPTGISDLMDRLNKLELDNKCLRLKMLKMEGKFTQDEVTNIRKMLISEDESSRTLAESIIENA